MNDHAARGGIGKELMNCVGVGTGVCAAQAQAAASGTIAKLATSNLLERSQVGWGSPRMWGVGPQGWLPIEACFFLK